ncbi:MAG: hydroxyacid dehydrogenase [Anaerolineae bacterium]|jgi:phosphoglycerate dehydrogenase-like enzyme|nr:hydroxyacid dehydrogenase [Anaerolineae bacterium]
MEKPVVAITIGKNLYRRMIDPTALTHLSEFAEVIHHPGEEPATKQDLVELLANADGAITGWDVAPLDADVINAATRLKVIVHMGGSVKKMVSEAAWKSGLTVLSARSALAKDVAETTLAFMIVGMKHIMPLANHVRKGGWRDSPYWPSRELHRNKVGIIGASQVGVHLIELLKPFEPLILVYDPYLTDERATQLGVTSVSLEELARQSDVISLHAPALSTTYHLMNAEIFSLMKDDCVIINTARGNLIDQTALVKELEAGRFFAFLDVTDPEPPEADSPLRRLDNVVVTPHLAGCIEDCSHMSVLAVEELRRFFFGEPLIDQVTADMLDHIG